MSVGRDTFFRLDTDRRRTGAGLDDVFAGPVPTPAWLVCGGPSLSAEVCRVIAGSPAPVMAVNLAGHGLLRPDMWTSYDPTCRFLRSLYLDASVRKFLHGRRASDLVPETTFKVCDSPDVYFFDRDVGRVFGSLIDFGSERIVDWADSMAQAIDILSRLGFRKIYLAGADLYVRPSDEQVEAADGRGVIYQERMPLDEFASACRSAGLSEADLAALPAGRQYHFSESKPWGSAVQTDRHYFRVVQWLRQSRRNLALHGIELISVTPGSRLNDHFESATVAEADAAIRRAVGDPAAEVTEGLYHTAAPRLPEGCGPKRDIPPLNATPDLPDAHDGDAA
ncbi:MAG: hypothetical protein AAF907_18120, partial [Planctomycetota bacterium]